MLERRLGTVLLALAATILLFLAFRLGMGLSAIHPVLRSEGEEMAIAFMAVLFVGLLILGMVAAGLVALRLRPGRRDR